MNALARTLVVVALIQIPSAFAQNAESPECIGVTCGRPMLSQTNGWYPGNWTSYVGESASFAGDDSDSDGYLQAADNCFFVANGDQADGDGDGVGNVCDNCAAASNFSQLDSDGDSIGDTCDDDADGDGKLNTADNCAAVPNTPQGDIDGDGLGDACDPDDDNDGIPDITDPCPGVAEGSYSPGDARCNADADGDGINDAFDNCPTVANANQLNTDNDGFGDVCDLDIDNDSVFNTTDNCPQNRNRDQVDDDGDSVGDACDPHYCAVVDASQPYACLDPQAAFRVVAGETVTGEVGVPVRLPIFSNRNGVAIRFTWTVLERPTGSTAAIQKAAGVVSASNHWRYVYPFGEVPTFVPDMQGTYKLQIAASLVFPDPVYPGSSDSTAQLTIIAN